MFEQIANVLKITDLRNRILFTLAMLAVYRLGIFIPAPGVDRLALGEFFRDTQGTLLSMYNMFSGGALEQFSVFVLGIMPYISASIIIQLGQVVMPRLERIKAEGQSGQKKLNQYTRYLTIGIAIVQSLAIAFSLEQMKTLGGSDVVIDAGWGFRLMTVLTMTAGSCFVMWLGEQITDRGVGQGASLIITAGIIAAIPAGAGNLWQKVSIGELSLLTTVLLAGFMFLVVAAIVFVERGQYRVPIQYAKRVAGRNSYAGGAASFLPLKVNVSGVIPPIFASSLMMFPATIGAFVPLPIFEGLSAAFMPGTWVYNVTYVVLIIGFTFFYTAVTFNPVDVADNLRKSNGFVPGVRPGKQTAEYLDRVLMRLTAGGSVYLSAVCILPTVLVANYGVPFYFGGTGLLIIVGVCMQTVAQIEGHLLTQHYDGLTQKTKSKGRRKKLVSQKATD